MMVRIQDGQKAKKSVRHRCKYGATPYFFGEQHSRLFPTQNLSSFSLITPSQVLIPTISSILDYTKR